MLTFANKQDLFVGWAVYSMQTSGTEKASAMIEAEILAVYNPLLYRGGWVIPGFGYSTERIGIYVEPYECGDPRIVRRNSTDLIQ